MLNQTSKTIFCHTT